MNTKWILWLIVSVLMVGCGYSTGVVVDKQERNDLPRRESYTTVEIRCNTDEDFELECGPVIVTKHRTYYDRAGYVLIVEHENGYSSTIEVTIDQYREYRVGDTYPKENNP